MPPFACSPSTNAFADFTLSRVFGSDFGEKKATPLWKVITLKVSFAFIPSSAWWMIAFCFAIGRPLCEHDWSMTKNISFGVISCARKSACGWSIRVKKPSSPLRWVSTAACICSPATA